MVQVTHSDVNAGYGTRTIELRDGWLTKDTGNAVSVRFGRRVGSAGDEERHLLWLR